MSSLSSILKPKGKAKNAYAATFALAGNANVGKSVLFNNLTGSSQVIGNWPGKTVEKAEGILRFEGQQIRIIDLPGIYSFSTFGMEEQVSREYIAKAHPEVVINVVDAAVLERNLFFTLQLIEMNAPLVICLNQVDVAQNKGITIDKKKLEQALDTPVVPTVAIRGEGIFELAQTALEIAKNQSNKRSHLKYGAEIEERIARLQQTIQKGNLKLGYHSRWIAIKLLESDPEITALVKSISERIIKFSEDLATEISSIHKEPAFAVIASERYALANKIAAEAQKYVEMKTTFSDKLDWLATHRVYGYLISAAVIGGLLLWTFFIGNFLSNLISIYLTSHIQPLDPKLSGSLLGIAWNGLWGGINAGLTLVVPFVIPFYLLLAVVEDSGLLSRVAFMMDSVMHGIGLHGKALIPIILGYGCNVPAIRACRIMETRREKLLAAFAITFAPCSARTIVIFGMVGLFLGVQWALTLYLVDIAIIFVVGRIATKVVPGKSTGLIMELHSFKLPSWSVVSKQTWMRTKSISYFVFPIYILGSIVVQVLFALHLIAPIGNAMAPLTVWVLGLPVITGIVLVFGVVRKELVLLGLVAIFGTSNLSLHMTPVQLVTLALVAMLYLPCVSVFAILTKDFGKKAAFTISIANIASAIIIGGIAFRLLSLFL